MYLGKRIGVVVPAHNEAGLIGKTLSSIPDFVDEIFAVDDASSDETARIIASINDARIHYVRHDLNRGVGAAIVSGYRMALTEAWMWWPSWREITRWIRSASQNSLNL